MSEKVVNASLLSATQAVAVFTSVMPPIHQVKRDPKPDDVRIAERAGVAIVVSIGLLTTIIVRDPSPAMVAVMVSAGMVVLYESVLERNKNDRTNR